MFYIIYLYVITFKFFLFSARSSVTIRPSAICVQFCTTLFRHLQALLAPYRATPQHRDWRAFDVLSEHVGFQNVKYCKSKSSKPTF